MSRRTRQQGGAAILILLAVLALGGSYYMIARMNDMSAQRKAYVNAKNAAVLNRAKQALIGYMLARAQKGGMVDPEQNPGALPCPEHAWHIAVASEEGTAGPSVGVPNPGYGTANCSSIGRYPWKTIGTEKLLDASGEPLWYVVGPTWRKTSTASNTVINSNTAGDLTLDGQSVVALIIAPGPAMFATASTTPYGVACAARSQMRTAAPAGNTIDPLDYLECYNAATLQFSSAGTAAAFNDQVVAVTTGDLMPGLEAAIAARIQRDIVPALKGVYASNAWATNVSAANPLYPYPAPFGNPSTSDYHGSAAQTEGLLPFFQTQGCNPATDPRCTTATTGGSAFLVFAKNNADTFQTLIPPLPLGWIRTQSTCSWSGQTYDCTGEYQLTSIKVTFTLRVSNVAMGLRTFDASKVSCTAVDDVGAGIPLQNIGCESVNMALQADGSALVTVTTNWTPDIVLSGWGTYANYTISFDRAVFGDHSLLDASNTTTGWFVRNEWYRLAYYAVAQGNTASSLPAAPSCTNGTTCLSIANVTPAGRQRAILILAGRSIDGNARPSATLADYLESGNASGSFERQGVSASTGRLYADSGVANSYVVAASPTTGGTVRFLAVNANTGASTLSTSTTGVRSLVDASGAALAAGQIKANTAVEATYDGTRFLLSKRLFNDRIIVVDSNP